MKRQKQAIEFAARTNCIDAVSSKDKSFYENFFEICQMSFFNLWKYDINDIKSSEKRRKMTNKSPNKR